jgi:hypothetical protein
MRESAIPKCGLQPHDDPQLGMSGFVENAPHLVELLESLQLGNDDAGETRGEPLGYVVSKPGRSHGVDADKDLRPPPRDLRHDATRIAPTFALRVRRCGVFAVDDDTIRAARRQLLDEVRAHRWREEQVSAIELGVKSRRQGRASGRLRWVRQVFRASGRSAAYRLRQSRVAAPRALLPDSAGQR